MNNGDAWLSVDSITGNPSVYSMEISKQIENAYQNFINNIGHSDITIHVNDNDILINFGTEYNNKYIIFELKKGKKLGNLFLPDIVSINSVERIEFDNYSSITDKNIPVVHSLYMIYEYEKWRTVSNEEESEYIIYNAIFPENIINCNMITCTA